MFNSIKIAQKLSARRFQNVVYKCSVFWLIQTLLIQTPEHGPSTSVISKLSSLLYVQPQTYHYNSYLINNSYMYGI